MYQAIPFGIMNDILSATAPQSARYNWNTTIQATMAASQINVPIMQRITSEIKRKNIKELYICMISVKLKIGPYASFDKNIFICIYSLVKLNLSRPKLVLTGRQYAL